MKAKNQTFDEKQILDRGKAYRNAFFTMLGSLFLLIAICLLAGGSISCKTGASLLMVAIFISVIVFSCTSIRLHSFDRVGQSNKLTAVLDVVVGLILIALIFFNHDGSIADTIAFSSMALSYLVIGVFYLVQRHIDKKKEKENDFDEFTKN